MGKAGEKGKLHDIFDTVMALNLENGAADNNSKSNQQIDNSVINTLAVRNNLARCTSPLSGHSAKARRPNDRWMRDLIAVPRAAPRPRWRSPSARWPPLRIVAVWELTARAAWWRRSSCLRRRHVVAGAVDDVHRRAPALACWISTCASGSAS